MPELKEIYEQFSTIEDIFDRHLPVREDELEDINEAAEDIKESLARMTTRKFILGKKLG